MLPRNALESRRGRLLAFSALYLSEGIPFGFSAIALTTYLRQSGVGLTEIGLFTGSLYFPWGFKWLWAPFVDLVRIERFGARRFWIVVAQGLMVLTLGVVWFVDPGTNLRLLTLLIAIHNVFAATQDVAIDALAVQVLPERERGTANGFMFGASYLGQAIGGSGALFVAGRLGFGATYPFVCGALVFILFAVTLRLREPRLAVDPALAAARGAAGVLRAIVQRVARYLMGLMRGFLLSGPGPSVGVLFGLMPFGAVALGLALGSTMQVDLGMTENQIATLNLYSTVVAAIGCVLGGWISDRMGHRRMLGAWFVLTTLPTLWLSGRFTGVSGMEGVTIPEYYAVAIAYSLMSGLIFGTSSAVFMGLTSPVVAATQFSGYMALRNLVYTYSAAWQGAYADAFGYARTLRLDAWIAFVPLLALPFLRPARAEPLRGEAAVRRLTVFSMLFLLGAPAAALAAGDLRAPGPWVVGLFLVATGTIAWIAGGGSRGGARRGAELAAITAGALLVTRLAGGPEWARPLQLAIVGLVAALVARGLLAGADHETRKEERRVLA